MDGHSLGHVNTYVLESESGATLIDAGWRSPAAYRDLRDSLRSAGLDVDRIARVLITHLHRDHVGLAGLIQERVGAEIAMHRIDAEGLQERFFRPETFRGLTERWSLEAGVPRPVADAAMGVIEPSKALVHPLRPDRMLEDDALIDAPPWRIRVLHTPGHTAGHLCYLEETTGLLFSGDHVFRWINTNPGYRPQSSADPIGDYLASLDRIIALPLTTILPGHDDPIVDPLARLEELLAFHSRRLDEVRELISRGRATPYAVASGIMRSREWDEVSPIAQVTAIGETYGHLVHLAGLGELVMSDSTPRRFSHR